MQNDIKKTKILHLYHDLMNLYGDWANAAILERELTDRARASEVERVGFGSEIDFSLYDFIYIGSGTERSLYACLREILKYKDSLIKQIEAGKFVLATGNAHEIFGRSVTDTKGTIHEALGLLDFETVHLETRITGDCVYKADFLSDKLVGFINRAGGSQEGDIKRPFTAELCPGTAGVNKTEGIRYKNLTGTYMTGPVLVRNPPLLHYYADLLENNSDKLLCTMGNKTEPVLCTRCTPDPLFNYQSSAYETAVKELTARIK